MSTPAISRRAVRYARRVARRGAKETFQYARGGGPPELHVFVAGAQRSGTNMVMNLLDRSFDTTVYHERDAAAFDHYLMREPEVIDGLVERARGRAFVIKALCEIDRLPSLMERYSPARTLWVFRDYDGAVQSSLRSFTTVARQVAALLDDPERGGWMGRGMSAESLARVRALHHPGMNDASLVALFWFIRNQLLFDIGLAGDPRVLPVRYERLVNNPHDRLPGVFAFAGLTYRPSLGRYVKPLSSKRREAPAIEPGVRAVCDELMRRIESTRPGQAAAV